MEIRYLYASRGDVAALASSIDNLLCNLSSSAEVRREIHGVRNIYPSIGGDVVSEPQKLLGMGCYEYKDKGSVLAEFSYACRMPILDQDNALVGHCAGKLIFLNLDQKLADEIDTEILDSGKKALGWNKM